MDKDGDGTVSDSEKTTASLTVSAAGTVPQPPIGPKDEGEGPFGWLVKLLKSIFG